MPADATKTITEEVLDGVSDKEEPKSAKEKLVSAIKKVILLNRAINTMKL
jgi:restriction endonuclease Mrr